MDNDTLTLASPAGMLCHVLKAYSTHPVDLTHAALERLGLPPDRASVLGAHRAVLAVRAWLERTGARPGTDRRDVVGVLRYLDTSPPTADTPEPPQSGYSRPGPPQPEPGRSATPVPTPPASGRTPSEAATAALADAAREVSDAAIPQLLSWLWTDQVCVATGRRAAIAAQLGYAWDTDDGYPSTPYTRSFL